MVRRWICIAALGVVAASYAPRLCAQAAFPYDRDLMLDARPMRGGKRVPILSVGADGHAQIDLWCKRGQGQAVIAADTVTIIVGAMADEPCTPERAQADEQMIAALNAVTNWSFRGDVVTFSGGATLRFRAAAN
jgi:heat shock protein HslJ